MAQPVGAFRRACLSIYNAPYAVAQSIAQSYRSLTHKVVTLASRIFPISKETPAAGSVGSGLYAGNARIVFVNGVGATEKRCREAAEKISDLFNSTTVHYTFLPLCYTSVIRSIVHRRPSRESEFLLETVREHLKAPTAQNAPQTLPGGKRIIVILHSGGGAMMAAIQGQLTRDERQQIDIIALGSAHLFSRHRRYHAVYNIVSPGDPVPYLCSLIRQVVHNAKEFFKPIHIVGSPVDKVTMSRHGFFGELYQQALEERKEAYDKEIISTTAPLPNQPEAPPKKPNTSLFLRLRKLIPGRS